MDVHGSCRLVVKWDGIFWGAHGGSIHGASIRLKVHEMLFTPSVLKRSVPSRRMLGPVSEKEEVAEKEEDVLEVTENDGDDDVFEFD